MLWTNDIVETMNFYQDRLDFVLDEYSTDWGWCHMHNEAVNIMFALPNEHTPYNGQPLMTGSLYIYLEEVDALWEKLKTRTNTCYEIANFPHGMREFAVYDNNGYMLQFGRELKEGEAVTEFE